MGSRSVLINGRKAHRLSDQVQHCGGLGKTMQGSPNVIVGDYSHGAGRAVLRGSGSETISTEFFFQFWGIPIDDALLLIKFSDGTEQYFQLRQGHLVVPHRSDKLIAKIELMPVEE